MENHLRKLITFEGIDFCGKSTQIKLLERKLFDYGQKVFMLRDPGGNKISEQIRNILLDEANTAMVQETEVLLYEAARAQMVAEKIIPFLENDGFVLLDRFYDSTTAYQGYGRGIELDTINTLNKFASRKLEPAVTFFLDISLETFLSRQKRSRHGQDRLESAGIEFFKKVKNGFYKIAHKNPDRIKIISSDREITNVAEDIWQTIRNKFNLV